MSMKSVFVTAAIVATVASGVAKAADSYLFELDATVPNGVEVFGFFNGILAESYTANTKDYTASFAIQNGAVIPSNFDNQYNYYNLGGTLVDTVETTGVAGQNFFNVAFRSRSALNGPLPLGGSYTWTPGFQPGVIAGHVSNGDNYDLQVAADVPEPATWAMMLVGFGLAGVAARRRASVATGRVLGL